MERTQRKTWSQPKIYRLNDRISSGDVCLGFEGVKIQISAVTMLETSMGGCMTFNPGYYYAAGCPSAMCS